jgi:serine/threonine protein kinase
MPYPSLEQYNEVLQYPNLALVDPTLKRGTIATTGLGLPLAMCGGFALTYTLSVSGTKYAVRCFHKESKNLEQRYAAISRRLKSISSKYFLDFEFQRLGVRVGGKEFPIVRMAWASGDTLATFVEYNLRNKGALDLLTSSLSVLSAYLSQQNIAHGDIQPENVMVGSRGTSSIPAGRRQHGARLWIDLRL